MLVGYMSSEIYEAVMVRSKIFKFKDFEKAKTVSSIKLDCTA